MGICRCICSFTITTTWVEISHLRLSKPFSLIYLSNLSYLHYLTLNIDLKFKLISELLVFEKKERSTWYLKKGEKKIVRVGLTSGQCQTPMITPIGATNSGGNSERPVLVGSSLVGSNFGAFGSGSFSNHSEPSILVGSSLVGFMIPPYLRYDLPDSINNLWF